MQRKSRGFCKTHHREHLLQSSAKTSGNTVYSRGDEICEFIKSSLSFPTLLVVVLYRPRAAQVRVKARAGWCFCELEKHSGGNNPEDLAHLTSTAYKSTNPRPPQRSQKGKWGRSRTPEPHSLYFYGQKRGVRGSYKAVSAPRPRGNGLEPGTNKTGCHLTEDEMLRWGSLMLMLKKRNRLWERGRWVWSKGRGLMGLL